jgi:hypothetical protein
MNLHINDTGPLGGQNTVVEIDETYVGGRARNRKSRIPEKRQSSPWSSAMGEFAASMSRRYWTNFEADHRLECEQN